MKPFLIAALGAVHYRCFRIELKPPGTGCPSQGLLYVVVRSTGGPDGNLRRWLFKQGAL
jgi:hypothetical protein